MPKMIRVLGVTLGLAATLALLAPMATTAARVSPDQNGVALAQASRGALDPNGIAIAHRSSFDPDGVKIAQRVSLDPDGRC